MLKLRGSASKGREGNERKGGVGRNKGEGKG